MAQVNLFMPSTFIHDSIVSLMQSVSQLLPSIFSLLTLLLSSFPLFSLFSLISQLAIVIAILSQLPLAHSFKWSSLLQSNLVAAVCLVSPVPLCALIKSPSPIKTSFRFHQRFKYSLLLGFSTSNHSGAVPVQPGG